MEPMTMMAIATGAGALLNALSAHDQGKRADKRSKEAIKAQKEADRMNLLASAYGIGAPVKGTAHLVGKGAPNPMIAALAGGLQGAGFGMMYNQMNKPQANADPYSSLAEQTALDTLINMEAGNAGYGQPAYMAGMQPQAMPPAIGWDYAGSPYDLYDPMAFAQPGPLPTMGPVAGGVQ